MNEYSVPKKQQDGYYYVKLKTDDGRRTVKARSIKSLKKKISDIEKHPEANASKVITFKAMFDAVQERKLNLTKDPERLVSVKNSVERRRWFYKRYIAGTDLEDMPISSIRPRHIEQLYEDNLRRYDLRKKATLDMRSVLKTTFELAMRKGVIKTNPYLACDFEQFKDMIVPDSKVSERGYSKDEMAAFMDMLHDQQKKPSKHFVSYALELQIICGLRRGEVPPLRWSDIHDGCIDICREQISIGSGGECVIVGHTKTWTDRRFPVTNRVDDLLRRLREAQDAAGYDGEYLFPSDDGVISNLAVYHHYKRMCKALGIDMRKDSPRGTHAFRRNAITEVANKTNGNLLIASRLYGNTPTVAEKFYYTGLDILNAKMILES